jgi:hypothetical protein
MKLIVAGGRTFKDAIMLAKVLDIYQSLYCLTEIVSGTANGADKCGEQWATSNGIKIKRFPADWDLYGKSAGHLRNAEMAEYGDRLLAFWDGRSKGTKNMIDIATKKGILVGVIRYTIERKVEDVRRVYSGLSSVKREWL